MYDEDKKESSLIKWAKGQGRWQQYALHLIAKYGSAEAIPEDSKNQVKEILVKEAKGEEPPFIPISKIDIPDAASEDPKTYLKSLGPVSNIDKLSSGQKPFNFAFPDGMTVIFGNNGSGKSGYARILKNLCHSHGNIPPLKGDATSAITKGWKIELTYAEKNEGESTKSIKWTKCEENKAKSHPEYKPLERIAFFDSHVANTYVEGDRELHYLPPEIRLYAELVSFVDELRGQFEQEIKNTQERLPGLPKVNEGTSSYGIISKLMKQEIIELTEEQLNAICNLSEIEKEELRNLKNRKLQTPERRKAVLEQTKRMLSSLKEDIRKSNDVLVSASLEDLLFSYQKYKRVKTKAERGVAHLAKDMPVNKDIGSDIWFDMFKAARTFAGRVYPNATPPSIASGDYCVLCHQELGEDAKNRLKEFDAFMDDTLQQTVESAKNVYKELQRAILSLPNLDPDAITQRFQQYADLGESKAEQVTLITSDIIAITSRLQKVKKIIEGDNLDSLQALIAEELQMKSDISNFIGIIENEERHTEELIAKGANDLSVDEQNKLFELSDKENCSNQKNLIKNYFDLSKNIHHLNTCQKLLNTTAITRQARKRSDELLTSALQARHSKEIDKLNLSYLDFLVESRGRRGNLQVRVDIRGLQKAKKSEILSEGEQRAVALAGFLTEVNEIDSGHAIIFDDPISSMDWDRMKLIAKRLAEEAKKRQVIIFTHNPSFALLLNKYYKDKNKRSAKPPFKQLWIGRKSIGTELKFGITGKDAAAWESKKVCQRIKEIERKIKNLETGGLKSDGSGNSEFERTASDIAIKLRQTWERAVEEVLLNGTIQRLLPSVMTKNLEKVQFDCNEDYQILHEGMSTISEFVHDGPQHSGSASPTLEQLKENKKLLSDWVDELENRRAKLGEFSQFRT